jgi:hypothetical protein
MPMKVKLSEDLNPGTWFPFEPGKKVEEVGGVCIRVLNRKTLRSIEKQTQTKKAEYALPVNAPLGTPAQRFEFVETDQVAEDEMIWDYCIVDWKKVVDEADAEIPCTRENKVKLMAESFDFSTFVKVSQVKLNHDLMEARKAAEKNS